MAGLGDLVGGKSGVKAPRTRMLGQDSAQRAVFSVQARDRNLVKVTAKQWQVWGIKGSSRVLVRSSRKP